MEHVGSRADPTTLNFDVATCWADDPRGLPRHLNTTFWLVRLTAKRSNNVMRVTRDCLGTTHYPGMPRLHIPREAALRVQLPPLCHSNASYNSTAQSDIKSEILRLPKLNSTLLLRAGS
jgi:hypothetical protein